MAISGDLVSYRASAGVNIRSFFTVSMKKSRCGRCEWRGGESGGRLRFREFAVVLG